TALVPSQVNEILYLSGYIDGKEKYFWLIMEDKQVQNMISLNLPDVEQQEAEQLNHSSAIIDNQAPSLTLISEFILTAITAGDTPGYYFYNPQEHYLYFQKDNGLSGSQAQLVATNIKSLFPINNKFFSLREDGVFSLLDNQGRNVLLGVSVDWLREHSDNVKQELDDLIYEMPHSTDHIMLQGLQDREGNPIRSWYDSIAGRIVRCGSSLDVNHDLVYLGLSEDQREALIYDNDEQQQYSFLQPPTVMLTPTETGLSITDLPEDSLWAALA
ncbi:MAG: hypothetical protein RAM36_06815, partial [Arsenophonus sp.]|nr:hypothetical protein [Arsenophonus sp.]